MNLRRAIRQAAKCVGTNIPIVVIKGDSAGTNIPIVVIKGDSAPICKGTGYHYRNKSGDLIHSPNAYRRAWGKPIYYPSTIRIEVGEEWPMHVGLTSCVVKKV